MLKFSLLWLLYFFLQNSILCVYVIPMLIYIQTDRCISTHTRRCRHRCRCRGKCMHICRYMGMCFLLCPILWDAFMINIWLIHFLLIYGCIDFNNIKLKLIIYILYYNNMIYIIAFCHHIIYYIINIIWHIMIHYKI